MRLRSEQYEKRLDEMNRMTGVGDFEEFVGDLEDMYIEEKRRMGQMTERTKNVLGEKFSLTFQNKYAQLSTRFDTLIQKAQLNFTTHLPPIQDLQQPLTHLLPYLPNPIYPELLTIISRLLLSSQTLYHQYIKQQVLTIKEQLETIVLKNYELEEQITNVYELYEEMKEKLDEESGYRVELERHLVGLEREIVMVREENYELGRVNKELVESKHVLDEVVQVTKLQQTTLKTSHLQNTDRLKQQQSKLHTLTQQNHSLHNQLLTLRHQLQQAKFQHQNFIQQINNLKQALDNRNYELDIYKNRQLRESPSNNNLLSNDKLQSYNQLVLEHYEPRSTTMCYYPGPCYNLSSEKGSLRSFMLQHQKSMGKLTIFESRQQSYCAQAPPQRILQKVSSCRKSLHSFERDNNNNEGVDSQCDKQSPMRLGFVFPLMNQLTFRPVVENQVCSQKEDKIWTQKRRTELNKASTQQEDAHFVDTQPQHHKKYVHTPNSDEQSQQPKDYPYIQPLVISGRKGSHQLLSRSKSIAEVQHHQCQQPSSFSVSKKLRYDEGEDMEQQGVREVQQQPEQQPNDNNTKSISKTKSQSRINCNYQWQNRSQSNSVNNVNRALIKKNIKAQRQVSQLIQRLQRVQTKNDQYEQKLIELQCRLTYYKQELNKSSLQCINIKSIVQNKEDQIVLLSEEIAELEDKVGEYEELVREKEEMIAELEGVQERFEQRLRKVKLHCREYIEKRHQQEVNQIVECYEDELKRLTQQIQSMVQKHQQPKISYKDSQSMTTIPTFELVSSVINVKCYEQGQSKRDMKKFQLDLCSQCIDVVIEAHLFDDSVEVQEELQMSSKAQVLREKLCMNSGQYSLSFYFPQHKSPSLQKKLLNTPSSTNYASQPTHQPTPTQFPQTPIAPYHHSPQQQLCQSLNESFHTVLSHTNKKQSQLSTKSILQSSIQKNEPMQSFFTCIQFSNESIIEMRKIDSNVSNSSQMMEWKQQLLSEDILFVAENQDKKKYKSLTTVQLSQKKGFIRERDDKLSTQQNKTETKQQSCQLKLLNHSKITQFIEAQQSSPIIPTPSKLNLLSSSLYSKSIKKHLSPYFKKHTNFLLSDKHFPKGFIPNIDKIYILHCAKLTTIQLNQDSDKENNDHQLAETNECFLFYNRLLVDLQSGKKLQLSKSSMLKFIADESRLELGNFQITITAESMLRVSRKNKRCFYMGTLDDGVWQINRLEEIMTLTQGMKK